MENKNKAYTILYFVLAASLIMNFVQWIAAKNQQDFRLAQNRVNQDAIEKSRATAQIYADSAHVLQVRQALYRDSARASQNALKSKIALLMGKIGTQAPPTPLEDSVCERFIVAGLQKDTVITTQKTLIEGFEDENVRQDSTYASVMRLKDAQISIKDTIISTIQDDRDYIVGRLLKVEKQNKKRFSIGPYVGVGWPGPVQVGVGVHYSIFKF